MNQEVLRIQMPRAVAEPRGAALASSLVSALRTLMSQRVGPWLAERGFDRLMATTALAMLAGNVVIYGFGGLVSPFIGIKLIDMLLTAIGVK